MESKPQSKWFVEAIRISITIISIVVTVVWFGAKLDKQIALNSQAILANQISIEKIMDNHLPHIQARLDELTEVMYEVKALVK